VFDYIWDNRQWFAGISLMSAFGDKAFPQAPFTEVRTAEQIHEIYGPAAMFASGLIVDGLHAFLGNLWDACSTAQNLGQHLSQHGSHDLLKRDWVRRAVQFSDNYFAGDMQAMTDCLKDCHLLHKWETIKRTMVPIDFTKEMGQQEYTDISTMGAQACAGGACSIEFQPTSKLNSIATVRAQPSTVAIEI
jgi:ribonucleoside-diphosphate reductase alpha chain